MDAEAAHEANHEDPVIKYKSSSGLSVHEAEVALRLGEDGYICDILGRSQ